MNQSTLTRIASRHWPRARAFLIALAIVLGLISGFPIPTVARLSHAPELLRNIAERLPALQNALLRPFRFITVSCQFAQRWTLFSTTGGIRYRLWIEARDRRSKRWALLYRAQDPEHRYLSGLIEYRRVMNGWNPNRRGIKPSYEPFALWISRVILASEPHRDRVRVRMERVQILKRAAGIAPLGDFEFEVQHGLEVLR